MSRLNVNTLGQAHEYYLRQLKLHLTPMIYEGLVSLYEDSIKLEEESREFQGNILKQFQKQLTTIPVWNQSILEEETRRILTEVDFLMDMVAAVFVGYVQILASIKLGGRDSKIRVRIPTSDIFIHAVYCKAAETFYYNPYKFQSYHVRESNEYIKTMIHKSIDDVIDEMIPVKNIIKEYISNVVSSHVKDNPRVVETEEPEEPGRILDHQDLGLDKLDSPSPFEPSPDNDDFGAGRGDSFGKTLETGMGGDDFGNDLDVGKDPLETGDSGGKFDFKDDETDIFSSVGNKHISKDDSMDSPFKTAIDDVLESNDPVFKPVSSGSDNDVFKETSGGGGGGGDDPFASTGGDDPFKSTGEDDPFKSTGGDDPFKSTGGGDDPFKSTGGDDVDPFKDDPFKNSDIPSPPELKEELFASKPEEINFFEDIP